MAKRDIYSKNWITENAIEIVSGYEPGELTIRALHYQLVAIGMTNTMQHYKRVVNAMIEARWSGEINFNVFSDHDREILGETKYEKVSYDEMVEDAELQVYLWVNNYSKNRWENQEYYIEVFIEKKALQGIFQPVCDKNKLALGACKGYPSLTFLYDTANRFNEAEAAGKKGIILYFGDYDPSGEDIPRSINENLEKLGANVFIKRCALMEDQVIEMNLPAAPKKEGDSRSNNWDGIGQVELDAINPRKLKSMLQNEIDYLFDEDAYESLIAEEEREQELFREHMKEYVKNM